MVFNKYHTYEIKTKRVSFHSLAEEKVKAERSERLRLAFY